MDLHSRHRARRKRYEQELLRWQEQLKEAQNDLQGLNRRRTDSFNTFNTLWGRYSRMNKDDPRKLQIETSMLAAEDDWLQAEQRLKTIEASITKFVAKCAESKTQIAYYQSMLNRTRPRTSREGEARAIKADDFNKVQRMIAPLDPESISQLEAEEARSKFFSDLMKGTFPPASRSNDSRHKPYRWLRRET